MAFVDELAQKLREIGTLKAVGDTWISFDSNIPAGGVPFCGQTVSRALYSDLWAWAQSKGKVKTETEWQELASAQGGNCQYYSDGDGSTTFRMPCVKSYFKGVANPTDAGAYIAEGLPIPQAKLYLRADSSSMTTTGATDKFGNDGNTLTNYTNSSGTDEYCLDQDALALNQRGIFVENAASSIYQEDAEHVTPETFTVLVGVYAVGCIQTIGQADKESILSAIATLEATCVKTVNGESPSSGDITLNVGAVVTDFWKSDDGLNWYRKWSDGWIEQGGKTVNGSGDRQVTVSLNTPFTTTNYVPQVTLNGWSNDANVTVGCTNLQLDKFTTRIDRATGGYWLAVGY